MKITIRVKPNAHKNEVRKLDDGKYLVSVTSPPVDNKANENVIEILAEYFGKRKRLITIIRGESARDKIVEIV